MLRRAFIKSCAALALSPLLPSVNRQKLPGKSFVGVDFGLNGRGTVVHGHVHNNSIYIDSFKSIQIALDECPRPFNRTIIDTYIREERNMK